MPVAGQVSTAAAQARAEAGKTTLRTAWGAPDLQGVWSSATVTPLERPAGVTKEFLTDAEIAQIEQRATVSANDEEGARKAPGVGTYNRFWFDQGTKASALKRSSMIVDPPDGRVPAFTAEAQKRVDSPEALKLAKTRNGDLPLASYEDANPQTRCISWGVPISSGPYNNNYEIWQTPDQVVILQEMIHNVRIIPLDQRPHLSPRVLQWYGSSRGRWEGQTLVVDTIGYDPRQELIASFKPRALPNGRVPMPVGGLHLVERFTRLNDGTLNYEVTIDDPTVFSRPWTAVQTLQKTEGPIYEYACHEGNHGMEGILRGARAIEKAEEAARKGSR